MLDTVEYKKQQHGFTLIELLITLLVGMIILIGMTAVFIAETRTASMLSGKTAAMGDLYLASQIMQSELRGAKSICWNAGKLVYQPFDAPVDCGTPDAANGWFEFRAVNGAAHPSPYICWKRPNRNGRVYNCQELLRNLFVGTGLAVVTTMTPNFSKMYAVTISAQYKGQDQSNKPLSLTFKVWPRN